MENGERKAVTRAESTGWIASPPEASAASLASRYMTCKFVLRRSSPFSFCMLASFHRTFPPRFIPLLLSPSTSSLLHSSMKGDPILVNALRLLSRGETKLKQRSLYSLLCVFVCSCVLASNSLKVAYTGCIRKTRWKISQVALSDSLFCALIRSFLTSC